MDFSMAHLYYGLGWLSFGLLHSLLASHKGAAFLQDKTGCYWRAIYNLIAVVHLAAVLALGDFLFPNPAPLDLTGIQTRGLTVLGLIGWSVFIIALWSYDLKRLTGIAYIKEKTITLPIEPFHKEGLHRFVRHPVYTSALMIIWAGVKTEPDIATAIWATIYIVIGLYFEEKKLARLYGHEYDHYKSQVPALVPWRGMAI